VSVITAHEKRRSSAIKKNRPETVKRRGLLNTRMAIYAQLTGGNSFARRHEKLPLDQREGTLMSSKS